MSPSPLLHDPLFIKKPVTWSAVCLFSFLLSPVAVKYSCSYGEHLFGQAESFRAVNVTCSIFLFDINRVTGVGSYSPYCLHGHKHC